MGKQVKNWMPPEEDEILDQEKPAAKTAWMPPVQDEVIGELVKKKEPIGSVSQPPAPKPGVPSGKNTIPTSPQKQKEQESQNQPIAKPKSTSEPSSLWGKIVNAWNTIKELQSQPADPKDIAPSPFVNAVKRGLESAETAKILNPFSGTDLNPEQIKKISEAQKNISKTPASKEYTAFNSAKTVGESLSALGESPAKIIAELTGESLSALASYGAMRIAAGTAIGAGLGSVVPGVGTAAGAGEGLVVGMADSSLGLEYSGKFIESLQEQGVNVQDPASLQKAFSDDAIIDNARSAALKKGIPIAIFDLISGGLAGKIASKPAKSLLGKIGQGAIEFGVQAAMGGAGELSGELASGEKVNPSAIIGEMIGELGTTPIEVSNALLTFNKATAPSLSADQQVSTTPEVIAEQVKNPNLEQAAETIQAKVEQAEDSGVYTFTPPANDQETQAPSARQTPQEGAVSEDQAKETLPIQEEEKQNIIQDDSQNQQRLQSNQREGQEPEQTWTEQGASTGASETGGIFQAQKEVTGPESGSYKYGDNISREREPIGEGNTRSESGQQLTPPLTGPSEEHGPGSVPDQTTVAETPVQTERSTSEIPRETKVTTQKYTSQTDDNVNIGDFEISEEKGLSFAKRTRTYNEVGGVSGVPPKNQFKLNQGGNNQRVHVILNDEQSDLYKQGAQNKRDDISSRARLFNESINAIAKNNRDKDNEVVLDFREQTIDQISSSQKKQVGAETKSSESNLRAIYERAKKDPNVSPEIIEGLSKSAKEYIPLNVKKLTEQDAKTSVDANGIDGSAKIYLDDNNGMAPPVDNAFGVELFRQLQEKGDIKNAIRVLEKLSIRATEQGQALNVFKYIKGNTGMYLVQRSVDTMRKKYSEKNEWRGDKIKKEIDKINKDAVKKVLDNPKVKNKIISETKKGSVKKAIDFLETLKADTKGKALDVIYGITAEAWNAVITAVQKGLQTGLTVSQAINKAISNVKEKGFEKENARADLDEKLKYFRVSLDPGRAIKEELKSKGKTIEFVITEHYSKQQATKDDLIAALIKDSNIPKDEAQAIADEIANEFNRLTSAAKERALKNILPKESRRVTKRARKDVAVKLIEQSNFGALSKAQYLDVISEQLGVPKLTEQQGKEIQSLSDKIQKAKGDSASNRATQDLLNYIQNLKGWKWSEAIQSIWYANILSGPSTWLVTNPFANLTNLVSEASIDILRNPRSAPFILGRIAHGLGRGFQEARQVLRTGYSPYKGEDFKTEHNPLLERIRFTGGPVNPANWLKYVTRAIKAGDVLFFHPLRQQRLAVLARIEAHKNGRTEPNEQDTKSVYDNMVKEDFNASLEQAESEGFKGTEKKIRAYEILDEHIPSEYKKDADDFASTATFNKKPEGTLGIVAEALNGLRRRIPAFNYVMPFVNTIMNVANEYMNYTPIVGYTRAIKGSYGWDSEGKTFRKLTNEERARIAIKATIGTLSMAALFALDDPDDKDNSFEITSNGYGDMKKNYELERTGWRPYSIRIGDTWFSYKNTPLSIPFASIGYMKDAQRYRKEATPTEQAAILAIGTFKFFMDLNTLSSLVETMEIFNKDNISQYKSSWNKAVKVAENTAKSVVIPNAFTQISRLIQEFTDTPIKQAKNIGESVIRDMPVLRDNLNNLYDSFGDPVIPKQLEKLIPLNLQRPPEDAELFEFLRENKLILGKPAPTNLKPNGQPMTEAEYNDFALKAAKMSKKRLLTEYKRMKKLGNKAIIEDWFEDLKKDERRKAKEALF
jgi:hypothetical protein